MDTVFRVFYLKPVRIPSPSGHHKHNRRPAQDVVLVPRGLHAGLNGLQPVSEGVFGQHFGTQGRAGADRGGIGF